MPIETAMVELVRLKIGFMKPPAEWKIRHAATSSCVPNEKHEVQIIADISVNLAQHMMPKNTRMSESIGTCWVRSAAAFQHMRLTMGVRKHM